MFREKQKLSWFQVKESEHEIMSDSQWSDYQWHYVTKYFDWHILCVADEVGILKLAIHDPKKHLVFETEPGEYMQDLCYSDFKDPKTHERIFKHVVDLSNLIGDLGFV
jgi:hypothetical protein